MILAGYPSRNVDILDEKRDKHALGLALVTVPISIVGALSGTDAANASQQEQIRQVDQSPNDQDPDSQGTAGPANEFNTAGSKNVSAAATPILSTASQLSYTVKAGDTVSQIARKFQLSTNQLLQINNLQPNALIVPGQKLKLVANAVVPASQAKANAATVHVVKRGETVNSIAKKYGISITTVLSMNKLSAKTIIFPGQRLTIGSVIPKAVKPLAPAEHLVQNGETLASIANHYGIALNNLLVANGLTESSLVYGGQTIKLKLAEAPAPETSTTEAKPVVNADQSAKPLATPLSAGLSSTDPHRPSNVCEVHGFHTVKSGESVSKIAAVYGLTTQSLLSENKLTWSSMIYIGQKLIIPGVHEIKSCPDLTPLSAEMKSNAQIIFRIGKSLQISDYGIVIALATAMQESGLRNLSYGDRDSVGLFQQRPSAHWGQVEQIMNPEYAARAFFGGKTSPTYGAARGLLDIKDWTAKSLTEAAQAVQISAYPNAYAKWEASAWVWFDQLLTDSGATSDA
jgi:LysM repeat protein